MNTFKEIMREAALHLIDAGVAFALLLAVTLPIAFVLVALGVVH